VPLDDNAVYKVAVPTYVATGGDGFAIIKKNRLAHHLSGKMIYLVTGNPAGSFNHGIG
jgi:2',3'-cyclic-nucleotide 2'-phosphodiesterase (5'-nucleotidase family)